MSSFMKYLSFPPKNSAFYIYFKHAYYHLGKKR